MECQARGGQYVIISRTAKQQVIGRMRAALAEHYASRLLVKKDQGKSDRASYPLCRLTFYPLCVMPPFKSGASMGRGSAVDDALSRRLYPMFSGTAALMSPQLHHNSIIERLATASRLSGDLRVNQRVPGVNGNLMVLRPDLIVTHEPSRTVVDVTVPFKNTFEALEKAKLEKILKYPSSIRCVDAAASFTSTASL